MISITTELVLRVILAIGTWAADDKVADKRARLEPVAAAIAATAQASADPVTTTVLLLAVAKRESQFALYVVEERCTEGPVGAQCDIDARGVVHATSPFQLHRWAVGAWDLTLTREERITRAAKYADGRLRNAMTMCRTVYPGNRYAAAMAGYGMGDCTSGNGLVGGLQAYGIETILRRVGAEMKKEGIGT